MPKEKKPVQDIPEEENVITPEEFEQLEKKEKKRLGIFSKARPKGELPPSPKKEPEGKAEKSESDRLVMTVEKMQAKLETLDELRQATEEKISRLSEEIGELRSAILEKDKTFNRVESGFEKVKEIFDEMQPKKIRAELDKKEDAIEKINAKVESFDTKINEMRKNVGEVVAIMEKIKDLKNLVAISETISKKMAKIEGERKETARIAGKVESMFSEITEKMTEFHNYKDKIEFSSESMHDMMKSLDMLEVKVENAFTKDDMKKVDDRFEQMEKDLTDKIQATRDIMNDLVTNLKKGGVKDLLAKEGKSRIDEINKKFSQIEDYEKSLKEVKDELAKVKEGKNRETSALISEIEKFKVGQKSQAVPRFVPAEGKIPKIQPEQPASETAEHRDSGEQDISSMIEQCHAHIDQGNIEEARNLYGQILSIYEQSKDSRDYSEAEQTYGKIKRLYYRLQIYA